MTSPIVESAHGSIPERTYERLRDLIIRGRIPAGARVVEAEVALQFGVSRTPVREALARLIHERYLVPTSTGRRTQLVVAHFTSDDVRELWGIIGALESYAVARVTALSEPKRTVIADDLRELNLDLKAESQSRPRDPDKLFELQTAFHLRFVYETAGSHLRSIYDAVRPQVQRYEWIYGTRSESQYQPSTNEHMRIIAAIRLGDAAAAQASVVSHWRKAAVRTAKVIEELSRQPRRKLRTSFR
ncbi:MAG: GntR family transcriptional regulator [Gemmatimonadales bacterium]